MDLEARASGIGALADDTRRALYEFVVDQPQPVGREEAARALGIAQHNVNFHLDRLAEEGLLEVEYRRLTGRSGPGAGRPSKLYRRATQEFEVSLPPRRYDLVGDMLAAAVTRAAAGEALPEALEEVALVEGRALGAASQAGHDDQLAAVARALVRQGYEPHRDGQHLVLRNCPFDSLAKRHTELVCGMNRYYVAGVLEGLGCADAEARLEPDPERCCVTVRAGEE